MNNVDSVKTDVLVVGGGPAGLATAIKLADELKARGEEKRILLIEKGASIGSHILSGAVIKTESLLELLPDLKIEDIPFDSKVTTDSTAFLMENDSYTLPFHPPYMNNEGNYIASLASLCRWLSDIATEKGVEIYSGFAVDEILYDGDKVIGAKTKDTGIDHNGTKMKNFQAGTQVLADITILAEGTRGSLAKTLTAKLNLDDNKNPQIYSLGVKEIWSVPKGNIEAGAVFHTMGYPLRSGEEFGGGFIYGLSDNRVALGLVVGLDYKDPKFDIHAAMQIWKTHSFVSEKLEGGKILEFGAKTLPEGGYYAMPKFYGDGFMIVGDSAGFLSTARLKGIHLAIDSGIMAAKTAAMALVKGDFSDAELSNYNKAFQNDSYSFKDLYPVRNFRQAMSKGMVLGGLMYGVQLITGGACPMLGKLTTEADNETLNAHYEPSFTERFKGKLEFDKKLTFDKVTDVYYSKAHHDEEQICHLVIDDQESFNNINIAKFGGPAESFCPAEVYEVHTDKEGNKNLRIHAENCVHCKTCDIKSPNNGITWITPYGGDGPDYVYM